MDFGIVAGVVSCVVSCGSLIGVFVEFGAYKGRSDFRLKNLEEQITKHNDKIEGLLRLDSLKQQVAKHDEEIGRLRDDVNAVEKTSANIERKLEGLASELKTSMQFIKGELSEVKEMVRCQSETR